MHPLRSFSKLIQFSLLAETISFSLLHLLIPNGGFLFTPHLLHRACQKGLSSPSSPHFPFDSSFILKVSGRETASSPRSPLLYTKQPVFVYSRGGRGCGRGDGTLVIARPLCEMY